MLNKLKKKLIHNDFIRSVSVLMSGTIISQIAIVLITPILTRIYGPEAFGFYAIYTALLYMITIISSLHYETAIPLSKSDKDAINTLGIALVVLLAIVSILTICFLFLHIMPFSFISFAPLPLYWMFLPFSILGLGLFQVFQLWALRNETYHHIAKGKVHMNLTQMGTQIGLSSISKSGGFLIGGDALGRLIGGVGLAFLCRRDFIDLRSSISRVHMKKMAIRYKKFPLISSWSSIFHGLSTHMPTFFIAGMIGVKAAGFYLIASRILALPEALFGNAVKQVYIAKGAKHLQQSFAQFSQLFFNTVKQLIVLSTIIFTITFVVAPFVFPFVFGSLWAEAGVFVQCLCILYACQLIITPITANFYLLELFHIQVLAEVIRFVLLFFGMMYAHFFLHEAWKIILCISIFGAIGTSLIGVFAWYSFILFQRRTITNVKVHVH